MATKTAASAPEPNRPATPTGGGGGSSGAVVTGGGGAGGGGTVQPTKPGPRKPHVVAHGRPDTGTELDGLRQQIADLARRLDALENRA